MTEQPSREVAVLNAALELCPAERAAYLDEACADNATLRTQVEALLISYEQAENFLEVPPANFDFKRTAPAKIPLTEKPGDKIGRYKLVQQIGEGGCGVVYMAEQEEPVRRRVALKVIKLGMDTKQVIARFEAERQALALMDHPKIAKVLDAGATDTGRPYFVMELVRGVKITDFCDEHKLSTEERLKLFIQVCQAIQHAHQKGVIHRDIKPSNILVTINDGVPVPKVIDFGIAKATQGRLTDQTIFTAFEQFIGTPAYMSPEQAVLTNLDIDTRSDIYSLGVLLYELLTGGPPFDQNELLAAGLDGMRRTILEKEPPKPSTRLSVMLLAERNTTASQRHTEPPKLIRLVCGDLDWIVMKALEKDRTRRYETANGFATDVQRHLNEEPIVARPPSGLYRFRKSVQRNRLAFGVATAFIASLLVGVTVSTLQAVRATRAEQEQTRLRQVAETNEKKSEQVAKFLSGMLKAAGPSVARGRDATVLREIMDKAATRISKELNDQPEVQGDLWITVGNTYSEIGDNKRAITNLQHAVDSYRTAFGSAHGKLAVALVYLGQSQSHDYDLTHGTSNALSGLEMARKNGNVEVLAKCLAGAASSFDPWFINEPGPALLREAIALRKQLGTNEGNLLALAGCQRALAQSNAVSDSERETMAREALAFYRQHLDSDHPTTAQAAYLLGQALRMNRKFAEAEQVLEEVVDSFHKLYNKNYPHLGIARRFLLEAMIAQGKREQAGAAAGKWEDWQLLGRVKLYHGDWEGAREQFARSKNDELLVIALRNLAVDEEYSRLRHRFFENAVPRREFGNELSAKPFLLLPVTGADLELVGKFADFTVRTNAPVWVETKHRLAKALAEFRAARFEAARDSASRAITKDTRLPDQAQAWFIQSLADTRLQQMETARTALANGEELVKQSGQDMVEDFLWNCDEWAIAESLRREAKALIEGQSNAVTKRKSE